MTDREKERSETSEAGQPLLADGWRDVIKDPPDFSKDRYIVYIKYLDSDDGYIDYIHISEYTTSLFEGFSYSKSDRKRKVTHWLDIAPPAFS